MTRYRVGYFVGSFATKSINRLLAKPLVRLAPSELEMTEIPFKDLPLYSYDYDANYPPVATEFKNAIAAVDAVLFTTGAQMPKIGARPCQSGSNDLSLEPGNVGSTFRQPQLVGVHTLCSRKGPTAAG